MSLNKLVLILSFGWMLWLASVLISIIFLRQATFQPALLTSGYLLGCFLFTPELSYSSKPNLDPLKFWSVFGFLWQFYRTLFKKRSVWSHGYILGAMLQICYLLICLFMFYSIAYVILALLPIPIPPSKIIIFNLGISVSRHLDAWLFWITGIVIGNSLHLATEKNNLKIF